MVQPAKRQTADGTAGPAGVLNDPPPRIYLRKQSAVLAELWQR